MSADNGVFVLQTAGPEFRVAYTQAIDSIYGSFNDETLYWNGNADMMRQVFSKSKVFSDIDDALNEAERMSYEHDYLEYGVCLITDFKDKKFD